MPRRSPFTSVPEPQRTIASHQEAILALKENVEVVTRQRSREANINSCPTWAELIGLGIVSADQANLVLKR